MKQKQLLFVAIVAVLLGGGFLLMNNGKAPQPAQEQQPAVVAGQQVTIVYGDSGFTPSTINIKKGDTVVWKNESAKDMWPASAMHPTHTVYPGSGIQKCNTPAAANIFDACGPVVPGQTWSFKFMESGSWKFHDHLSPKNFGTISVE